MDINEMRRLYREKKAQAIEQNPPVVTEQTNTTLDTSESVSVLEPERNKPERKVANSNYNNNIDNYENSSTVSLKAIIAQQSINVRKRKGVPYGIITDWNLLRSVCGNVYEVDIRKVVGYGSNDKVNLLDFQWNIEKLILGKQIDTIVSSCITGHNDVQTTDDVDWDKLISMSRTILNSAVEMSQLQVNGYTNIDKISNAILRGIIPGTECRSANEFRTIFNKGHAKQLDRINGVSGDNSNQQDKKWKDATQKAINLMFQLEKCSRSEQKMSLSIIERLGVSDRYIAEWNLILRIWKVFIQEHKVDTKRLPNPENVRFNHRPFPITGSSGVQELIREIVNNA